MSIDDLYNNFKIVEQSVKKYVGASSGAQNLSFMTAPSTSSTNDVNTAKPAFDAQAVNTARPKAVKTARPNFAVVNVVRAKHYRMTQDLAHGGRILVMEHFKTVSLILKMYALSMSTQGELNAGTSSQKEEISKDCIDGDGPDNENDEKDKYEDDSSPKEVNTASSYDQDSPKDMFTMGASHTLEATHVEFFNDEDEPEVDLGNIINSYTSAFLYGTIKEEVYVTQPPGFKDPDNPDKVYKVVKALYGLHQAPRAWYETLANYLLGNGFKRGKIDQTLFIKKQKGDILLVQVYVDDIIFGSTNKELCTGFEKLMKDKFQMSSMGELTFFLGLQVQQKEDGIFISQDKYVLDVFTDQNIMFCVSACARFQVTPKTSHLLAVKRIFRYLKGKPTLGLWYSRDSPFELVAYTDSDYAGATQDRKSTTRDLLTKGFDAGRHYLVLPVQVPAAEGDFINTVSFMRILRLREVARATARIALEFAPEFVYVYCMDFVELFINQQLGDMSHHKKIYVTSSHTKKIFANMKREGKEFSGRVTPLFATMMVLANQEEGVDSGIPTDSQQTPIITHPSSSRPQKKQSRRKQRKETEVPHDETHHDDNVPIPSNDPLLSGEDRMQLTELMILGTNLQKQVLDLEKTKDAQAKEIAGLKKRVQKRVESSENKDSLGAQEDASKQGRSFENINKDAEVSLVDETQGISDDAEMFDTDDLHGDEVIVDMAVGEKQEQSAKVDEREVSTGVEDSAAPTIPVTTAGEGVTATKIDEITTTSAPTTSINEITLAQTLIEIKAAKPNVTPPKSDYAAEW
ncbi:putative ribonuclease H-like domain-containing protein [Tanacetum coccineum]